MYGACVGVVAAASIAAVCYAAGDRISHAVPALLLLVPVCVASAVAGWRVGVGVASFAAILYDLTFLEPIGGVKIGLTEDLAVLVAFVMVAALVGLLVGRSVPSGDLDHERAMLLRSVSHDLRAPLNTIKMLSTDLLERHGDGVDDSKIGLVVDETDRLDRIVGNLLSYSRVRAGTFAPELEAVAAETLVRRCVSRMGRLAHGRIVCRVGIGLPDVLADPVQIDQVLTNLVENALRFAPDGTAVTLSAERRGNTVEFSVRDHGPGLPAALLTGEAILEPRRGSAGLGLSVCRAIVAAHGGRLGVQRPASGGARVVFALPVADPSGDTSGVRASELQR